MRQFFFSQKKKRVISLHMSLSTDYSQTTFLVIFVFNSVSLSFIFSLSLGGSVHLSMQIRKGLSPQSLFVSRREGRMDG